jgi:hypothetical protein
MLLFIKRICSSLGQSSGRAIAVSFFAMLSGFMLSQSALAAITIAAPVNGTKVSSPVWVRAHNTGCNGLAPTAFGYSLDNSSTLVKGVTVYDVDTKASMASGTHTIHYKSWTSAGVCPTVSTTFSVSGGSTSSTGTSSGGAAYSLPSYAVPSASLDDIGGWSAVHDGGTPGSSHGSMVYPASISGYDYARKFYMTYYDHGGERWHVGFGNNASAANFALDTYVYLANPSQVQNLEIDLNQVMSNGKTVIFGTQCSSISKTWEYVVQSYNHPHWKASNVGCNPLAWKAGTWHHIQIGFHRDSYGVVTHDYVNLDGVHHVFSGAKGSAALSLGWAKGSLTTNFQIDGEYKGSGSVTAYVHKMLFYHW